LRVIAPGLATRVVDRGRPRSRSLGVPVGGAADRTSYLVGNALVGNGPDAAALEITLSGPTLEATCELACVVYGAPFDLDNDRQSLRAGKTFTLRAGEALRIGGTPEGARAYLCVGGGLQTKTILESRSSLEPLAAGDELPCLPGAIHARFLLHRFDIPEEAGLLRVLDGAQSGWFKEDEFLGQEFTVTPASDRMGLRLRGAPLTLPGREIVSEPVCPGTVQVTRDGQCIVLGVDGQTIGGYPKIAHVIAADLDRLGQLRPGERVRFRRIELAEATALYRRQQAELDRWLLCVRTASSG
jgi:antagonist of KipI